MTHFKKIFNSIGPLFLIGLFLTFLGLSTHSYFSYINSCDNNTELKADVSKFNSEDCDENTDYSPIEIDWFMDELINTGCLFSVYIQKNTSRIFTNISYITYEILSPPPKHLFA